MEKALPEFGHQIEGPLVLKPTTHTDRRGAFARLFCPEEMKQLEIEFISVQMSLSRNTTKYTLRGMHHQIGEWAEGKIVRVTRGAIFDVAIDLRKNSETFCKWCATELSAENMSAFYIPKGFSHGFLTLENNTDVVYQIDRMFEPGHGEGVRWNDQAFDIKWPASPCVVNERDAELRDFQQNTYLTKS